MYNAFFRRISILIPAILAVVIIVVAIEQTQAFMNNGSTHAETSEHPSEDSSQSDDLYQPIEDTDITSTISDEIDPTTITLDTETSSNKETVASSEEKPTIEETTVPLTTATPIPTSTPVPTVAPTSTPIPTSTPQPTATPVPTIAATATPRPTATPKPTATPLPTATPIPTSTPVPTVAATATPVPTTPPVATATPVPTAATAVERYKAEVLYYTNQARASHGLAALSPAAANLSQAAQVRANETIISFSHTRPNGSSAFTVLGEYSVNFSWAAENIAYLSIDYSAADVVQMWMDSPGHRKNILNPNLKSLGVGYAVNGRLVYATQLFIG